ncbi:hypothetical protein [Kitasatospora sp. GAS204B]|uniref:hypothetical protein n=1 Tax=unclassified Kitasatospora TaxID=2633591 RepID=UPI0024768FE6|nr:hypothetical protein [Kitasatospora sp. GAS204B]MDH6117782.1 hypothetical protein [Kitasatospora sp. GAS204B]
MASLEANPGIVHLVHRPEYASPGLLLGEPVEGSIRVDGVGWVHVAREDGSRVSFPPHAVARIDWVKPAD